MDDVKPLCSTICSSLMRIGTRMATVFDKEFASLPLTQAQFRVLLAIVNHGPESGVTPAFLSDYLFIAPGAVTGLTDRMVASALISRQPGENRRSHQLVITEYGRSLIHRAIPAANALAEEALDPLTDEEQFQIDGLLQKIESLLRANTTVRKHAEKLK